MTEEFQKPLITPESRGIDPDNFCKEEVHEKMASIWSIVERLKTEKKEFLKGRNERIRHYEKIHSALVEASVEGNEVNLVNEFELDWRDLIDTAITNGQ